MFVLPTFDGLFKYSSEKIGGGGGGGRRLCFLAIELPGHSAD